MILVISLFVSCGSLETNLVILVGSNLSRFESQPLAVLPLHSGGSTAKEAAVLPPA